MKPKEKPAPQITMKPIDALIPYARNARTHSDAQVARIAASIKEFGFTNPVLLDGDNGIIAGHGRVLAARKLGLKEVPCIELKHLTKTQARAYILADNKLALDAGWDNDTLKLELEDLKAEDFNLELTGFNSDELKALTFDGNFAPGSVDDQGRLDEKSPTTCPACGHTWTK